MTIDWWTLGIQTINLVILVWLLKWFFWSPLAGMIEQRRITAQKTLADAEAKRDAASAALTQIEQTRAGFEKEREAILAAAREAAENERAKRLDEAKSEALALEAAARLAIENAKEANEKAWAERSSRLAVEIAKRMASRLGGAAVHDAFLDWLLKEIRALPDLTRQAATAKDVTLDAISAMPLNPDEQARCRKMIGEAFGVPPQIVFSVDPALIAGLELHGPHLVIANSWKADLAQILEDLTHGT